MRDKLSPREDDASVTKTEHPLGFKSTSEACSLSRYPFLRGIRVERLDAIKYRASESPFFSNQVWKGFGVKVVVMFDEMFPSNNQQGR